MPHFCQREGCGGDTYICQICSNIHCSQEEPSIWMPVGKRPDGSFREGNVCPRCIKNGPPTGHTDWVEYAKDYIAKHGSMSAAEVRALNEKSGVNAAMVGDDWTRLESAVQSITLRDGRVIYDAKIVTSLFEDGWTDGVTRFDTLEEAIEKLK